MVISNYSFPRCQYHLGGIKEVYIQSFEDNVLYHIDDSGLPICERIDGELSAITPTTASLTQNSNFDRNRFAFSYELKFGFYENIGNLHEDFLKYIRENKFRAFIKTNEGHYYLVNAEYPCSVSYSYNWENHICEVILTSVNNIPTMLCTAFTDNVTTIIDKDCAYLTTTIPQFEIIESDNVIIGDDYGVITSVTTIGNATWKTVQPLKDTFVFNHSYDGKVFLDEIQFTIEMEEYLSTWHYNLLEFVKNTYAVRFKTNKGHTIIINDLFPSFELMTEDGLNKIRISLRNKSYKTLQRSNVQNDTENNDKRSAGASKIRNKVPASTVTIRDMTFPTIECISPTMARRILFPQIGINGDETGKYYVLEGYEEYFAQISDLIVGTINENSDTDMSLYVATTQCADFGCIFSTSLAARNYMINGSTAFFSFISSCGWEITYKDSCLSFSDMSGGTNEWVVVDVTSSCEKGTPSHFTIKVGDDEYDYTYTRVDTSSCFIADDEINITAQAQTLTIPMNESDVEVVGVMLNDNATSALTVMINGSTLTVVVPEYTDFRGFMNIWRIQLQAENGRYCEVYIYQEHPWLIYKVEPNMYECYEGDKYHVKQGYSGYTRETATIPTGIYTFDPDDAPWERNSPDCAEETIEKWIDITDSYYCEQQPEYPYIKWSASTETECSGTSKYQLEYKMVSNDGESWSATSDSRIGELIETQSEDCGYCPKQTEMRDSSATTCDGFSLRYVAYQWESRDCGETWQRTSLSGYGTVIEAQSTACGYEPTPTAETQTRWVDSTNTMCNQGNLYHIAEQQISTDGGITWTSTGKIRQGTLIESGSTECYHEDESGDTPTRYKWVDSLHTICDGGDLYKVQDEFMSTDGMLWSPTGVQRRGALIESNSPSCADEIIEKWIDITDSYYCEQQPDHPYIKWSASTETMCSGTSKYNVEYKMVSDDGTSWSATSDSRIGTLIDAQSVDCGYGEILYKWEEGTETICYGTDLYGTKEQYKSTDSGTTWAKTGVVRIGAFIESDSLQCSNEDGDMYKWEDSSASTICIGDDLYAVSYRYVSKDGGLSWIKTGESRTGGLIETDSRQCSDSESGETIYKWEDSTETMCDGTSLYYKSYEYESNDGGITWERTGEYEAGTLIDLNSPQCMEQPIYKWESDGDTTCYNGDLYEVEERWVSYDSGTTWSKVGVARRGDLIERESSACTECEFETRWISTTDTADTICSGTSSYFKAYEWWSDDCWATSARVDTTEYRIGDLYEEHSYECGYREYRWTYIEEVCDEDLPSGTITGDTPPIIIE